MKLNKFIILAALMLLGLPSNGAETKSQPKKPSSSATPSKKQSPPASKSETSDGAEKVLAELTAAQSKKLLDLLNTGDDAALQALPGVGEVRSAAIKKARPFKTVADAAAVDGVGEGVLKEWVKHAKAGFPAKTAAKNGESSPKKKAPEKGKAPEKAKAKSVK